MANFSAQLTDKRGPVIGALVKFIDQNDSQVKATTTTKGFKDKDGAQPGEYEALGLANGIYTIQFIGSGMKEEDWLTDVAIGDPNAFTGDLDDVPDGTTFKRVDAASVDAAGNVKRLQTGLSGVRTIIEDDTARIRFFDEVDEALRVGDDVFVSSLASDVITGGDMEDTAQWTKGAEATVDDVGNGKAIFDADTQSLNAWIEQSVAALPATAQHRIVYDVLANTLTHSGTDQGLWLLNVTDGVIAADVQIDSEVGTGKIHVFTSATSGARTKFRIGLKSGPTGGQIEVDNILLNQVAEVANYMPGIVARRDAAIAVGRGSVDGLRGGLSWSSNQGGISLGSNVFRDGGSWRFANKDYNVLLTQMNTDKNPALSKYKWHVSDVVGTVDTGDVRMELSTTRLDLTNATDLRFNVGSTLQMGTDPGTTGEFLKSQGSGVRPLWAALTASDISDVIAFSGAASDIISGIFDEARVAAHTGDVTGLTALSIGADKILTAMILDGEVDYVKIQGVNADRMLGRLTTSGTIQELTAGSVKTFLAISAADISDVIPFSGAASDIASGTFAAARIPTHTGDVTGQTALTIGAGKVLTAMIGAGEVDYDRIQGVNADRMLGRISTSGTIQEMTASGVRDFVSLNTTDNVTFANLIVSNLTVNGTTTTVNSTVVTIDDPIFTLGGDTAPTSDDNKDRGIEFRYYDTAARLGFFGYDDSTDRFVAYKLATNTSEVFSGTRLDFDMGAVYTGGTLRLNATGALSSISLPNDVVLTATILDGEVDYVKIQGVNADRMLGRLTTSGTIQEMTAATVRTFLNVSESGGDDQNLFDKIQVKDTGAHTWLATNDINLVADSITDTFNIVQGAGITLEHAVATDGMRISHPAHTGDVTGATSLTIGANKILTAMILDGEVDYAKIQGVNADRMLGRLTTSGTIQEMSAATVKTFLSISAADISDVAPFSQSGTYVNLRAQATTAGDVGLGNVTNESKATMFTNPVFTGATIELNPAALGVLAMGDLGGSALAGFGVKIDNNDPEVDVFMAIGATHNTGDNIHTYTSSSNISQEQAIIELRDGVIRMFTDDIAASTSFAPTVRVTINNNGSVDIPGTLTAPGVTSGANPGHTHSDTSIDNLNTSATTAGVFAAARIPTHTGDVTGQTALAIGAGKVLTAMIGAGEVDYDRIQGVNADRMLGRLTTSGTIQEMSAATVKTFLSISAADISDVAPFSQSGTYTNLRAQATTAGDVGLGSVTNESKATMFTSPTFTGTVAGFTMGGVLAMGNADITGVNWLKINDPGEGIEFGGGSSGLIQLYVIDDATDRILTFAGNLATNDLTLRLNNAGTGEFNLDVNGTADISGTLTAPGVTSGANPGHTHSGSSSIAADDDIIGGVGITVTDGANTIFGGNATIAHDAHTGDVTGSTALTIGTNKILTAMILDGEVDYAKIQGVNADRMLGRLSTSGTIQEMSAATVRTFLNIESGSTADQNTFSNVEVKDTGTHTWLATNDVVLVADGITDTLKIVQGAGITLEHAVATDGMRISHLAHTGDVTGQTALTIGASKVLTAMINDGDVTLAKIENIPAGLVMGRAVGAGSGSPQVMSAATTKTLLAIAAADISDVIAFSGAASDISTGTFATARIPEISYAMFKPFTAESVLLGRAEGGGAGDAQELTSTQVQAILNYASLSIGSTQNAYFGDIYLRDDTTPSHHLKITDLDNLTAARTLSITVGDANRTLTLTGNTSLTGTNTGDQTITLTGDVTGSGTGSFAATIGAGKVLTAMIGAGEVDYDRIQGVNANRMLGRLTTSGTIQELSSSSVRTFLGLATTDNVVFNQFQSTDYMKALGGMHVGGTSDPGTDNLLVDGDATITGAIIGDKLIYQFGDATASSADRYLKGINGVQLSATHAIRMPRAGSIVSVGCTLNCTAVGASGSIHESQIKARIGSTNKLSATMDTSTTGIKSVSATTARGNQTFTAGQMLVAYIDMVNNGPSDTVDDLVAYIEVVFDT